MANEEILIKMVLDKVNALPQISETDRELLFPNGYIIDFIADQSVSYQTGDGATTSEFRFKGMMKNVRSNPILIQLISENSVGKRRHTLSISHSLNPRAGGDSVIARTYEVVDSYASEIAGLHRTFFEKQSPDYVGQVNKMIENREGRKRTYAWKRFAPTN